MATFIALSRYTDQGIRSVNDTLKRAEAARALAKKFGAQMTQIYWTLGHYDLVAVIEAPDEASASAFALALAMGGNIRTQTLRAFNDKEMTAVLAKLA